MNKRRVNSPGIRRTGSGWQVFARVRGRFVSEHFPPQTDLSALKAARERLIAQYKHGLVIPGYTDGPGFAADAQEYLDLVRTMPSYDDRAYEIGEWAKVFGRTPRSQITGRDIRRVLERWRKTGSATGGPLSPSSLNRRRTALMSLWTTLDGRSAVNPVRDVPPFPERSSEQIRAVDPRVLYRVIARVGRSAWKSRRPEFQGTRRSATKTRARLRLMLWTGWPQTQIMRLTPADIDWKQEAVRVSARRKGKGTRPRWVPLFPGAVIALRAFVAAEAWGPFSTSGMHKAFQRALAEENAHRARYRKPAVHARPYDLRHTALTEMARAITDERALQELALHSSPFQTRRYTEGATADRLLRARAEVAKSSALLQKRRKR